MNIEEFANAYLQEHRHDVLLNPYNGLVEFAEAFKKEMLKGAVEGVVMYNPYPTICLDDCKDYDFKDGDKVRVIVLKDDSPKFE